jgi:hypothetical protein
MKKVLTAAFILLFLHTQAQERIDTDRPDQTESVFTVPLHYFQGELGFGEESFTGRNYHIVHPAFLFKYGIAKRVELRLEGNLLSDYLRILPNDARHTATGFEPIELGTKVMLIEEKGLRPKTSLIVHVGLPFTGYDYDHEQNLFPSFRFLFQHTLSERIGLGYNLGAEWDGYSSHPAWTYTISPNVNIGKKWYAYIEAFGVFHSDHGTEHQLDGGFAYYLSNNTKIDLSAGFGLGNSPLRHYTSLGFSFRLPPKNNKH